METTLFIVFIFSGIALWFWAVIDVSRSRFKNPTMNTVWLLAVLFFPVLGSIFYLLLRKKFVTSQKRKFQPNFNRTNLKSTE
jgi:hypothetical protein